MDHRRKWDREKYERLEDDLPDCIEASQNQGSLAYLKPRSYKIDFDSFRSRTVFVNASNANKAPTPGFYCSVCDVVTKTDAQYLEHVNGRKHQRVLGMSMKVRRSTCQEVRRKFRSKKKELEERKAVPSNNECLLQMQEEERKMNDSEHSVNKRKKVKLYDTERELPSDLQELMGFSSFVMNKKK